MIARAVEIGRRTIEEFPFHEIQGLIVAHEQGAVRVEPPCRRLEQYTFGAAWQLDDRCQRTIIPELRLEHRITVGPDPDVDPLRANLANVFEGIDEYVEVVDPLLGVEIERSSISGALVGIAGALAQGLRHYENGHVLEALWWWQFSYLSDWGERASSVLRTLQAILAHLRLDVEDDVAAEAEYDALQP